MSAINTKAVANKAILDSRIKHQQFLKDPANRALSKHDHAANGSLLHESNFPGGRSRLELQSRQISEKSKDSSNVNKRQDQNERILDWFQNQKQLFKDKKISANEFQQAQMLMEAITKNQTKPKSPATKDRNPELKFLHMPVSGKKNNPLLEEMLRQAA